MDIAWDGKLDFDYFAFTQNKQPPDILCGEAERFSESESYGTARVWEELPYRCRKR